MGRTTTYQLLLFVSGLLMIVIGLNLPMEIVHAQNNAKSDYIGSSDCEDCHRNIARDHANTAHALAFQKVERNKSNLSADFEQGDDVRTVQFPNEDAPRAFTADDIAFVVGAGRYIQRYVYQPEKGVYYVLPAEWDTVAQAWRTYTLDETWPSPKYDWVTSCAGCHTTGLDVEKAKWKDEGVQCEACHGPGEDHAETADDAGSRPNDEEIIDIHNAITVSPDAEICGQCHNQGHLTDSTQPFSTEYRPGTELLDPTVYQLLPKDDPAAWYDTGHARLNNMQFNEWLNSAHARSLDTLKSSSSAQDGCTTCHSGDYTFTERLRAIYDKGDLSGEPPAATTLASAQFGITCTTCHSPHDGAENVNLLVTTGYELCTSCHRNTDLMQPLHHPVVEMFEGQSIIDGVEGIPSAHFSAEDGPRCVTCHMSDVPIDGAALANHTWKPVIPGESADSPPDACSSCHEGLQTADLQSLVEDTQSSVRSRLTVARARLGSITPPEDNTPAKTDYDHVVQAITFVQNDGSLGVHNYAYVDKLLDEASVLMAQLSVPGSSMQPTEAPAPTATPAAPEPITVGMELPVRTGLRPMTFILIGIVALILLGGTAFILRQARRNPDNQEAIP